MPRARHQIQRKVRLPKGRLLVFLKLLVLGRFHQIRVEEPYVLGSLHIRKVSQRAAQDFYIFRLVRLTKNRFFHFLFVEVMKLILP